MRLDRTDHGGITLISVEEERIDAAIALQFRDKLVQSLADWIGPVVVDLQSVKFVDSSGLGAIVAAKKMLGQDRPLELARLQPNVAKVFKLTRMDTVFRIHGRIPAELAE